MGPDGKKITRGSRSPSQLYETPELFAEALVETAAKYEEEAKPIEALPVLRDLRIALNVAAADMRPLVIVRGESAAEAKKLEQRVATLAWSKETVGLGHYLVLDESTEFEGLAPKLGVSVVQPDPYGLGGKVLSHVAASASEEAALKSISDGIAKHDAKSREHDDHVREARRKGITWESEIPVTDTQKRKKKR